jgi:hypothetical protein
MFPKERVSIPSEELLPLLQQDQVTRLLFNGFLAMQICKWQQGMYRMFLSKRTELLKIAGYMSVRLNLDYLIWCNAVSKKQSCSTTAVFQVLG